LVASAARERKRLYPARGQKALKLNKMNKSDDKKVTEKPALI
jgi:hypothetical protein